MTTRRCGGGLFWVDLPQMSTEVTLQYSIEVETAPPDANSARFTERFGHIRNQYYWHPVIIDDSDFYHFGASIKDLGKRGSCSLGSRNLKWLMCCEGSFNMSGLRPRLRFSNPACYAVPQASREFLPAPLLRKEWTIALNGGSRRRSLNHRYPHQPRHSHDRRHQTRRSHPVGPIPPLEGQRQNSDSHISAFPATNLTRPTLSGCRSHSPGPPPASQGPRSSQSVHTSAPESKISSHRSAFVRLRKSPGSARPA
jgi:hypothetical protein